MELDDEDDPGEAPIEHLADRLGVTPDELDDVWEEFAERAVDDTGFLRGSTPGADADETAVMGQPDTDLFADEAPEPAEAAAVEEIDRDGPDDGEFPLRDSAAESGFEDTFDEYYDPDDDRLDPEGVRQVDGRADEYVVPTEDYCEQCEHFNAPPDVGCANDGTEIVQFEDVNNVRVRNCPIVKERQRLDFGP